jgi:hypothetical protein
MISFSIFYKGYYRNKKEGRIGGRKGLNSFR